MEVERSIVQHYTLGALEQTILDALVSAGKDIEHLTPLDLAPVDEFHIGGRLATIDFADSLAVAPGARLLDVGSGLGGPARYFAGERSCHVSGIDLTEEYVRTATALAARVGLAERVDYRQMNALALPFDAESFDGAYMLHVGMNIPDKVALFREVRRVLKPGARFGIYDVMRGDAPGALSFPVPWATTSETSFLEDAASYRRCVETAGFAVQSVRDRRDFTLEFFRKMQARAAQSGSPSPLGLHILMGRSAPQKVANMIANFERGLIVPTEIIGRAN